MPRDRKSGKYVGTRDDHILEDWISDAQRAMRGQPDREAVDNHVLHLEVVAKEEVKLKPVYQWLTPAGMCQVLRDVFGEQLTVNQARRKFFSRLAGRKGVCTRLCTCTDDIHSQGGEAQ